VGGPLPRESQTKGLLWGACREPVEGGGILGSLPDTPVVIELADVHHSYDGRREALQGVSFTVRRGEVFGLLGRNGAGKSTLIKVMTTLLRPTRGTLRILGWDPLRDGPRIRSRIGVVQQGESWDFTTVEGNLDVYGVLWGLSRPERQRRQEALLTKFGLQEIRRKRLFDLSGGQKRRVQVAREFMHDMDILFLDEPTVGLDILMRRSLLDSIREEVRRGLTVVFTTHNLEEADYLCDRVAVIESGRILVLDTVENLKRQYRGKKTLEVSVTGPEAEKFYADLPGALAPGESWKLQGNTVVILTEDPRDALSRILQLSARHRVQFDWLNIRQNTLEDVFLQSVKSEEPTHGLA
jgi:ABC-2 type transport system ATP-binding protein